MKIIACYKGFKIYQATKSKENNGYLYAAYRYDQTIKYDSPEWQSDSTRELTEFIDSYHYKECDTNSPAGPAWLQEKCITLKERMK